MMVVIITTTAIVISERKTVIHLIPGRIFARDIKQATTTVDKHMTTDFFPRTTFINVDD